MSSSEFLSPQLNHLAIIMDGNGRWANSRGLDRAFGHVRGAQVAKKMIESAAARKIKFLTLYAFSTENWFRPLAEVNFLMRLLARHLKKERRSLIKNNIRFETIGDLTKLPPLVQTEVQETVTATSGCTGMKLVFALSYGGRQELTHAFKSLAQQIKNGEVRVEDISEKLIQEHLFTNDLPDPDLIIRTSGESRLSNFLLWQSAYSELYFTPTLWPDFKEKDLQLAFDFYASRERRFGKIAATCETKPLQNAQRESLKSEAGQL